MVLNGGHWVFDDEVGEWYSLEKLAGEGAGGELSAGEGERRTPPPPPPQPHF